MICDRLAGCGRDRMQVAEPWLFLPKNLNQPASKFTCAKLFKIVLRSGCLLPGLSRFGGIHRSSKSRIISCSALHISAMENSTEIKETYQKDPVPQRREKAPRIQKPRAKKMPPPALPVREIFPYPYAKFELMPPFKSEKDEYGKFRPRLGTFSLQRSRICSSISPGNTSKSDADAERDDTRIEIQTPAMICGARRGMVKHLSRDNVTLAKGVEWIHVPLEDLYVVPKLMSMRYFDANFMTLCIVSNTQFQYQHTIHPYYHSTDSSHTHHLPTSSLSLLETLSTTKICPRTQMHSSKCEPFVVYAK
jgi:hypothetical protein